MMHGSSFSVFAALVATLSWAAPAHATVMVEVPLDEMARSADAIVVGEVLRSEARLVLDGAGRAEPHTFTELRVTEWIHGGSGARVVIEEIGGVVGDQGLIVSGVPTYSVGQEVVLFLERQPSGSFRTFAMAQGRFLVLRGVPGAPDIVRRDLEDIAFARWSNGEMSVGHQGPEPALELGVFLDTIRAWASAPSPFTPPRGPGATGGAR